MQRLARLDLGMFDFRILLFVFSYFAFGFSLNFVNNKLCYYLKQRKNYAKA